MSRGIKLLIAMLLGGLVAIASVLPLWHDIAEKVGDFLLLFSLPGAIIALPLGAMGVVGNAHDPNAAVMAVVDCLFYAWLFYWLMTRRPRHER